MSETYLAWLSLASALLLVALVFFVLLAAVSALFFTGGSYEVLGKVPHPDYPSAYRWVLGEEGKPLIVGSSTVYHFLSGERCSTPLERDCSNATERAEMLQAAGKQYKVYSWRELMGVTE
jgi:hypothetical protein